MVEPLYYPGCCACAGVVGGDVGLPGLDVGQGGEAVLHDGGGGRSAWTHLDGSHDMTALTGRVDVHIAVY